MRPALCGTSLAGTESKKKRTTLIRKCTKILDPIKTMIGHFFLRKLTTRILLIPLVFSIGALDCHARDFTKSLLNSKFINPHENQEGSFFLSNTSIKEEKVVHKKSRIFKCSYKGPPYLLEPHLRNNFVARLWRDFDVQIKAPFKFAHRHPIRFSLVIVGIGAMVATDHKTLPILAPKSELQENGLIKVGKRLSTYGETVYAMPIIVGFGAYGWLTDSPGEKETFLMVTEALATSATWTGLLKVGFGRERPSQREAPESDWTGPFGIFSNEANRRGKQFMSFPSGHSSAIWSIATVLAHQYPKYYIVPVLSYSIASAVAYSRMVVDAHWPSDIVVGSVLGYLCARQVLRDNPKPGPRDGTVSAFNMSFDVSRDYYGIRLHFGY
jgi:membrane-associated phospholipid phosphatase